MKRSLPVGIALTPDATLSTPAELKEAVNSIAGAEISQQVGDIMCYSHLTEIDNLDMAIPSKALTSPSHFPGVHVF